MTGQSPNHAGADDRQNDQPGNADGPHLGRAPAHIRQWSASSRTDWRGEVDGNERERLSSGFGAEVRRLRKDAGLTQVQCGELAGIHSDSISRFELGKRRPTVDAIKTLARILCPAGEREAVEDRLASLAGDSLREGAARRRRAKDNRHRRAALESMKRSSSKLRSHVRQMDAAGQIVPGNLRKLAESATATVEKLKAEIAEDQPEIIPGHTPVDAVPATLRGRKENINQYLKRVVAQERADQTNGGTK